MSEQHHVVIVGASLGGLRTAQSLRSADFAGRITLVGDEERPPYDRPPLSKQVLSGEWQPEQASLADDAELKRLELDLRLGVRATHLDLPGKAVVLDGDERVGYDTAVIATGATPRAIPGTPHLAGIHTLRTLDECLALRADLDEASRVVVVGAGFIGAEVAATAREKGLDVTVLEALPIPLARGLGSELGPVIAGLHLDHGVDLRTGTGVAGFEGDGRVERVLLADRSSIDADVVVVGIGVVPNTAWLDDSGLELRDGIVCDEHCRAVGAPDVYAVGDVARWYNPLFEQEMRLEHWTNAVDQAMAVAATITGTPTPYAPVPYVWSDQYGSKIMIAGHVGPTDAIEVPIGSYDDRKFVALAHHEGRLTAVVGLNEPRKVLRLRRMLESRPSAEEALAAARELA
jgi:NADPH-dependent 2,4-dienoyl-CoA reductase/sulfur reductase-like enzyme